MNVAACIRPNQQNLFPCLDCDWWVPLSMWDNADKRSNLICPVGSCILLAVCTHFFMCGTLHCTHMMVYLVLPNCSLLTAGWGLLFVYENCLSACSLQLISHRTVFFSHNKLAVSTFQPVYKLKRTGPITTLGHWSIILWSCSIVPRQMRH